MSSVCRLVLFLIIFALGNLTALRDNQNHPRLFRRQFILIRNNYKSEVGPSHLGAARLGTAVRITVLVSGGGRQQTWFPSVPSAVNAVSSFEFQMEKSRCCINGNECSLQLVSLGNSTRGLPLTGLRCRKVPPLLPLETDQDQGAPLPLFSCDSVCV